MVWYSTGGGGIGWNFGSLPKRLKTLWIQIYEENEEWHGQINIVDIQEDPRPPHRAPKASLRTIGRAKGILLHVFIYLFSHLSPRPFFFLKRACFSTIWSISYWLGFRSFLILDSSNDTMMSIAVHEPSSVLCSFKNNILKEVELLHFSDWCRLPDTFPQRDGILSHS